MLLTQQMPSVLVRSPPRKRRSIDPLDLMEAGGVAGEMVEQSGEDEPCESCETFRATVTRSSARQPLGIEIDMWDGKLTVGNIEPRGLLGREGSIEVGDEVAAVNSVACRSIEDLKQTIHDSLVICFVIVRRPPRCFFSSDAALWTPRCGVNGILVEEWTPVTVRLLSTRVLEVEGPTETCSRSLSVGRAERVRSRGGVVEVSTAEGRMTFRTSTDMARQWQQWLVQCVMISNRAEVALRGMIEEVPFSRPSSPVGRGLVASLFGGGSGAPSLQRGERYFEAFFNGVLLVFPAPDDRGSPSGARQPGCKAQLGKAECMVVLRPCGVVADAARPGALLLDDTELDIRWRLHSMSSVGDEDAPHDIISDMCEGDFRG